MSPSDAQEMQELAASTSGLLGQLGGAREVLELEVTHFRARLDNDDQGAKLALLGIKELAANLEAGDELLETFSKALLLGNLQLARAIHAGALELVARSLTADEEGPEGLLSESEEGRS